MREDNIKMYLTKTRSKGVDLVNFKTGVSGGGPVNTVMIFHAAQNVVNFLTE